MEYRRLGSTDLRVSLLSFGCGPVSGLLTGEDRERQLATIERALEHGVNWFDTAATYGDGRSEESLGRSLAALSAGADVHVATKVRLALDVNTPRADIARQVRESVSGSLTRLGIDRISLLQLHNSVTEKRGDLPTSLTLADVLGAGGVAECFGEMKRVGRVAHLGFTGLGDPPALAELARSGVFDAAQAPTNVLDADTSAAVTGDLRAACHANGIGFFAMRVYAGGALLDREPSPHTLRTPFFPLDAYERDRRRAHALGSVCEALDVSGPQELAVRFVVGLEGVTSALVGFGEPAHVDAAVRAASRGPLPASDGPGLSAR